MANFFIYVLYWLQYHHRHTAREFAQGSAAYKMDEQTPQTVSSPAPEPTSNESEHKALAIIGYIIPILFFIPLLSDGGKKSAFAMFHANQQLVLLIVWLVAWVTTFLLIGFFIDVFAIILVIFGIVNAAGGKMKPLPLVGGITILK